MSNKKYTISLIGFIITLLGALLFSTKAIIVKKAFGSIRVDYLTLLAVRMVLSLPFYVGAALLAHRREGTTPISRRQWWYIIALGLCGYYLSSLLDFIGLQYISAGLERLILFLYPTFTVLINRYVFGQRMHRWQRWALLLTYAGIGVAFAGELRIDTGNPQFYFGSLMVFCCAITYAIYIAGSGRMVPVVGVTRFTAYAMLAATGGVFAHFLLRGAYALPAQTTALWGYGLLLAIIATVIPSFLVSAGLKRIGGTNVAIISSIGPVSTILQAHYILGEPIGALQLLGTALVIAGVLLIGKKSSSKET